LAHEPLDKLTFNAPPELELLSKITSSAEVGTEAPDAPPEEVDHREVDVQFPLPPTQYLVAMMAP
jgi:hypothetical protein